MALRALSRRLPASARHSSNLILTKPHHRPRWLIIPSPQTRFFSAESVSSPSNLVQVYVSQSTDPYLNLSIEHFLLQKSHPDSVVLLLYTNRPCIVIGRNQNPWVEVNLGLVNRHGVLRQLRTGLDPAVAGNGDTAVENGQDGFESSPDEVKEDADDVLLVRRRSGGGTVFHDLGNVNYSVICPPALFDRNKHAEMVVRALRGLRVHNVRVNERHDIVLDVDSATPSLPSSNNGNGTDAATSGVKTFKISGSAYKLTRTRSLHHGTCLLSSPHLPFLGTLLRSPAAPYIKARGVESVRSPVRNVGVSNADFENAVVSEFLRMYAPSAPSMVPSSQRQGQGQGEGNTGENPGIDIEAKRVVEVETIQPATVQHIPEITAGVSELRSRDWVFAQTPQFTFSSHPTADDPRPRPDPPTDLPPYFFPADAGLSLGDSSVDGDGENGKAPGLQMTVRHGQITDVVVPRGMESDGGAGRGGLVDGLKNLHLHHVDDWRKHVGSDNESAGRWLNQLFGVGG